MILLDSVVALLLLASIAFSLKLNRSITRLKESKKEIAESIMEFSSALARAEESIARLKILNSEVGTELKENLDRARFLANDLSFLIQKGNEVSDRIEGNVTLNRDSQAKPQLALTTRGSSEFERRAAKISEGQVSTAYNSLVATEESSMNTKGVARKYAMQQALELIARKNLAKAKVEETEPQEQVIEVPTGKARQRRLFDALKWGRQLNG